MDTPLLNLKEWFLRDNPNLTPKQKMAWELYCAVQELCHSDPEWAKGIKETAELMEKKRKQFESLSLQASEEHQTALISEPAKPLNSQY